MDSRLRGNDGVFDEYLSSYHRFFLSKRRFFDRETYQQALTSLLSDKRLQLGLLRPIEDLKIECGKRHFKNFEQVCFKVVSSLTDLVA